MKKQSKNTAIYIAYEDFEAFDPVFPEKNLLLAILSTALTDLKRSGIQARRARDYILSAEDDYVFSFQSVCDYLDVDVEKLLRMTGMFEEYQNITRDS